MSPAFFSSDFFIFQYPSRSLPSLLSSPLAGPLPHCYAGRVGPEKFPRRSPNFLLPAKARVGGRRSASGSSAELQAGSWLCTSASAAGAFGEQLGCRAPPQSAALGFSASKSSGSAEKDEKAPPCPRPRRAATGDAFVQPGPSQRAESARPADSPRRLPPARAPALCKILPGTEVPAALEYQRVITLSASRSRLDEHHGRAPEATRDPERARAVKEATRPRRSDALSEGAPSRSQGLPASIHPPGPSPPASAER